MLERIATINNTSHQIYRHIIYHKSNVSVVYHMSNQTNITKYKQCMIQQRLYACMSLLYLASQILKYLLLWQHKKGTRGMSNESRLRRWRWKHETQVGHNHLMLTHHAILNAINHLLEILKLRSKPSLILVHHILHRIKSCVIDHYKLLHASTKKDNLSR